MSIDINEKKNKLRVRSIAKILSHRLGKELENLSILEYGCNTGWASRELALMNNSCTGVDILQRSIDKAIEYHRDVKNLQFKTIVEALPFPDQSFDFVFSSEVIEHVPQEKRNKYFSEFRRVMKDDGFGYISYPNFWFPIEQHHFIPFHHWLQRIYKRKNLLYEDIPSKQTLRKELSRLFEYKDISSDFLKSDYVKTYHPRLKSSIASFLLKTPFSIQDYLLLLPKGQSVK